MSSYEMKPVDFIVVHESASPHRGDTARDVHLWHTLRGWEGVGYHYLIDQYGDLENGRPEYWMGSHVRYEDNHYNSRSLGIMLFGQDGKFSVAQFDTLKRLLFELRYRHGNAEIVGHRDLDPRRTCPGFNVRKWCREQGVTQ